MREMILSHLVRNNPSFDLFIQVKQNLLELALSFAYKVECIWKYQVFNAVRHSILVTEL
jgi:hypothetical protein